MRCLVDRVLAGMSRLSPWIHWGAFAACMASLAGPCLTIPLVASVYCYLAWMAGGDNGRN